MIKTFLINLDKNPERLAESTRQLSAMGVAFERVKAVYGKDLSAMEKRTAVNRFRWWCAQGRRVRDGEIGCALSHLDVYQRIIGDGLDYACVLEDDNRYRDNFAEVLHRVAELVDVKKAQVILFTNFTDDRAQNGEIQIVPAKSDQCTAGYLITRLAAERILAANYPLHVPCDFWRRWVNAGLIELYHAFPTCVAQDGHPLFSYGIDVNMDLESNVEGLDSERVQNFSLSHKMLHKMMRLVGVTIDRMLPLRGE